MSHEFDFNRDADVPVQPDVLLAVGEHLAKNYLLKALDFPLGYDIQGAATQRLEEWGFTRVEWIMDPLKHDICLLLLWRNNQQVILEFAGTDDMVVSLFGFMKERVVEPIG